MGAIGSVTQRLAPYWLPSVLLVALVVRVAFVVVQLRYGVFDMSFEADDSRLYRALAEALRGGSFGHGERPTAFVGPGYPAFLAVLSLVNDSTLAVGLVQSALGALTAVLVGDAAQRLTGRRSTAWAAGGFAAVYPHLVFWTGYVLTETLYTALVVAAVWAALRALEPHMPRRWAFTAGALAGAGALVRPPVLGIALLLLAAGALWRQRRPAVLPGLAGLLLVMVPWTVRNAVVMDAAVPVSTESGYVLWQGNSPDANGGSLGYVHPGRDFQPLDLPEGMSEAERNSAYLSAALRWMVANPGRVAALVPAKLWNMWRPTYTGGSSRNALVTLATYPVLLAAGAAGLWLLRRHPGGRLLLAVVIYHVALHALATGMIRFRVPVEAVLLVPAGIALDAGWRRLRPARVSAAG